MSGGAATVPSLRAIDYARALAARDARFDGVFFVGITTTRIYCRPVCPARVTHPDRRRFFNSAAAAEQAGYRPCLRCRPELAPGRAVIDAVSRLAREAADRIAAGALNGHSVAELAQELGVSERHLRRALEREIGVSPVELAQTHRLLMAKRLLADTTLSITQIAYASGFQSLRRFNATFRARYRMAPTAIRRNRRERSGSRAIEPLQADAIKVTMSYRPPLAWPPLLTFLVSDALRGAELVEEQRYARVVSLQNHTGVISVQPAPRTNDEPTTPPHLDVWLSPSLVPVIMPLLARLRRFFDLDAEPSVIDAHLRQNGLAEQVKNLPGIRVGGAMSGFEAAFRVLLRGDARGTPGFAHRVVEELGTPAVTVDPRLNRCVPTAKQVLAAGVTRLVDLGVPRGRAEALVTIARALSDGLVRLERRTDPQATHEFLMSVDGMTDTLAAKIMMRGPCWPDAFPVTDPRLQRTAGVANAVQMRVAAEHWRPWRSYAAVHLWIVEYLRDRCRASHT